MYIRTCVFTFVIILGKTYVDIHTWSMITDHQMLSYDIIYVLLIERMHVSLSVCSTMT